MYALYHNPCHDGITAAWVFVKYCKEENFDYYLVKADYAVAQNLDFSIFKDQLVYLLDFTFKEDRMRELCKIAKLVFVLDHHKTAVENIGHLKIPNLCMVFDMNRSGAMITWDHFFPTKTCSKFIEFIQAYDLGHFDWPEIYNFMAWFESFNCYEDVKQLDNIINQFEDGDKWKVDAAIIQGYKNVLVDTLVGFAKEVELDGVKFMKVNCPLYQLNTFIGKKLVDTYNMPAWMWAERKDGYSNALRSRNDLADVSEVAKKYGGGGHRNASGFTGIPNEPCVKIRSIPWGKDGPIVIQKGSLLDNVPKLTK